MSIRKSEFSKIAHRILSAIDNMTDEDFSKLTDDSFRLELKLTRIRQKDDAVSDKIVLDELIQKLSALPSREEAQQFFISNYPAKKVLEVIAKELDISISKQDRIENIREKIIEATVGARLRSQAIRGNN